MQKVTSKNNSIIKDIRSLSKKKYRWKNKLFIIEGIKLIEEALDNHIGLKYIVFSQSMANNNDGETLLRKLESYDKLILVDDSIYKSLSDMDNPQGVLAVVEFNINDYKELLMGNNMKLIYLDAVMDPGNLGTIIRSADAFNIDGIIMSEGTVDPYNSKVVRATMGSMFRVPLYFDNGNYDILKELELHQYKIYATYLKGSIHNYYINYNDSFIIVIGNESTGVSQEIINISDKLIKIPIPGGAESLNAGVASSILMYEVAKQCGEKS